MASYIPMRVVPAVRRSPAPPSGKMPAEEVAKLLKWNSIAFWSMLVTYVTMAVFYGVRKEFRVFTLDAALTGQSYNSTTFESSLPIERVVGQINVPIVIAAFPLVTAAFHALAVFWGERVYGWVTQSAHWLRWVEYSISAPIMLLALSVLCRVRSVGELAAVVGAYHACMLLGAAGEYALSTKDKHAVAQAVLFTASSFVAFGAAWVPPFISFFLSINSATDGVLPPAFVYVAFLMLFVSNCLFPAVFCVKLVRAARAPDRAAFLRDHAPTYEYAYVILSFASKMGLAWNIFGSAMQVPDALTLDEPADGYSAWILISALAAGCAWVAAVGTAYVERGSLSFLWGSFMQRAPPALRRWYAPALVLAASAHVATMVIAAIALDDARRFGWAAGMLIGVHILLEAVYIPAAERALGGDTKDTRWLQAILYGAWATYTAFAVLGMVYAPHLWERVVLIVLGTLTSAYLLLFDAVAYPMYAL
jgi:hypothetical protein